MKTRRHHNNHALTSTKRGKRKAEVAKIAKRLLKPKPYCEDYYISDLHPKGPCPACPSYPRPKKDVILERPEEEPGYGHGV